MKKKLLATGLAFLATPLLAQNPLIVAPKAYKLWFENDWVRVVRVHYGPREQVIAHDHTPTSTAYVYLNNSGPVVFNHLDKDYGGVTREPTKAGAFRVYYGLQEVHEVSNASDLPSDFLRVEFKTVATGEMGLKGKFFRESYPEGDVFQKIQFENEQIRITRLNWPVGKKVRFAATPTVPTLVVALSESGSSVSVDAASKKTRVDLGHGQSRFIGLKQSEEWENTGKGPIEVLRFDFKTPPMSKEDLEKKNKKHEHAKS